MAIEAAPATATSEAAPARSSAYRQANLRTGEEYLRSLKDGRCVYVDGERVKDVTVHPAFREAAKSVARLFDIAAAPENREIMTYPSPKTGAPVWRAWQIPKSHADLRLKRLAAETWAEATLRPDGPHARPCRRLHRGLCGKARAVRGGRGALRRQPAEDLRAPARQPPLRHLRDRAAPDRPQQAGPPAEGPDALCRRGQGARRRHRDLRRPAARDRRRVLGLPAPHLHPPDARGRRGLCQRLRDPDRDAGAQALFAPRLRRAPA